MAKIDLDTFRAVLGVSTIYTDADLQQVADAAEDLVDGLLTYNRAYITAATVKTNTATFYTSNDHTLSIGKQVTISGCGAPFDGLRTVADKGSFWFTAQITTSDTEVIHYKPTGTALTYSQTGQYDTVPAVREAALAIGVEIFQQRVAGGGMVQTVDYQPSPHKLGRALLTRVHGLLAPYMDAGSFVG